MSRRIVPVAATALALGLSSGGAAQAPLRVHAVDTAASRVWVVTHRSGVLGFLGHEHAIVPDRWTAEVCAAWPVPAGATAEVVVETASLEIDTDEARALAGLGDGPGEDDRRDIRRTMLDAEHLAAEDHPRIRLALVAVSAAGDDRSPEVWAEVTLRGVTRAVEVPVEVERPAEGTLRARGAAWLLQSDFGIEPTSVAGVVRVADEVDLHFDLLARRTDRGCRGR